MTPTPTPAHQAFSPIEWIAERWAKYRGYCRHCWDFVPLENPGPNDGYAVRKIPGGIAWKRKCSRCDVHQQVSTCFGYAFLDREWNPLLEGK